MVGRSCRRFGLCKGSCYIVSNFTSEDITTGGKEHLQRNDNNYELDEGPFIAEQLIKKFNAITSKKIRQEIIALTTVPVVWRTTREEFAK